MTQQLRFKILKLIRKVLNIGEENQGHKRLGKVRLLNLLGIITISSTILFIGLFILTGAIPGVIFHIAMVLLYSITYLFNHNKKHRLGVYWIFGAYYVHLFVMSGIILGNASGFQYFYFAAIPSIFLVSDYREIKEKLFISALAIALFFLLHTNTIRPPLVKFSTAENQLILFTVFSLLFLGVTAVLYLFTYDLNQYEKSQQQMIDKLLSASNEINELRGIIPICANCKKIRDDKGLWNQVESYFHKHSQAKFTHSICPECKSKLYPDLIDEKELQAISGQK